MNILANEWITFSIVAVLAFLVTYLNAEKTIGFLHRNSLGQREEIMKKLDLMFVETDKKKITITLLLCSFGIGSIFFFLLWPKVTLGLVVATVITILGWTVPKFIVNSLYEKRCQRFVDQMVDGMTIMANGVSSGLSTTQSMERVVENLGNPISQEFNLALSQVRIGMTVEEALNELAERVPRPDVQMFVTSVNILKETGGNLAETFQTINETIRERQKIEKKISALTAQGIAQGVIITLIPFVLMLVLLMINREFVMPMFTTTLGIVFLLIMVTLQVIGGIVIKKVVTINV